MTHKVVYSNPWFKIFSQLFEEKDFFSIEQKQGVCIIAKNLEGKIAFVNLKRHTIDWISQIELPRGGIEECEETEQAAHREAFEEVGATLASLEYLGVIYPDSGILRSKIYVYTSSIEKIGDIQDKDEIDSCTFYSDKEILEKINNQEIKDGISISALFLYFLKNKKLNYT